MYRSERDTMIDIHDNNDDKADMEERNNREEFVEERINKTGCRCLDRLNPLQLLVMGRKSSNWLNITFTIFCFHNSGS